ncbi:MAG TPA: hypothetical protein VEX14_15050, partial [Burkholderiaceae bacterium]|nr:hypothetical protein [Burkholderiaceae bacterium]
IPTEAHIPAPSTNDHSQDPSTATSGEDLNGQPRNAADEVHARCLEPLHSQGSQLGCFPSQPILQPINLDAIG